MFTRSEYIRLQQEKRTQLLTWVTNFIWELIASSFSPPFLWAFRCYYIEKSHLFILKVAFSPATYILCRGPEMQKDHTALPFAMGTVRKKRFHMETTTNKLFPIFICPLASRFEIPTLPQQCGRVGCTDLTQSYTHSYTEIQSYQSKVTQVLHHKIWIAFLHNPSGFIWELPGKM